MASGSSAVISAKLPSDEMSSSSPLSALATDSLVTVIFLHSLFSSCFKPFSKSESLEYPFFSI